MGVDFWAVKLKNEIKNEDICNYNCWDIIEQKDEDNFLNEDLKDFVYGMNDKDWYNFCVDKVGCFVGGDPLYENSRIDIQLLTEKLNQYIKENPNDMYVIDEWTEYSNEDIRKFVNYINEIRNNGYVIWVSY